MLNNLSMLNNTSIRMTKVYVGNLDRKTDKRDLEGAFGKFGKVRQVQLWADRYPTAFAFIEFEDER